MKKIVTGMIIAATMVSGVSAFAQDTDAPMLISQKEYTYDKVNMSGIFEEYTDNQLWMKDGENQFVINVDESTLFIDLNGNKIKAEDLEKGTTLMIVSDIAQTRSIPPQSYGYVVAETSEDISPVYAEINDITKDEQGNTILSSADGNYEIILGAETSEIDTIKAGSKVLAYSNLITMSIPAKVPAEKIVILEENEKPEADGLYIGGKKVEDAVSENGTTMIPLRKICEELGYTVEWNDERKSINVGTLQMGVYLQIGENKYSKAKMAAWELSSAPVIINEKTYVPVDFFTDILEVEVTNNIAE